MTKNIFFVKSSLTCMDTLDSEAPNYIYLSYTRLKGELTVVEINSELFSLRGMNITFWIFARFIDLIAFHKVY